MTMGITGSYCEKILDQTLSETGKYMLVAQVSSRCSDWRFFFFFLLSYLHLPFWHKTRLILLFENWRNSFHVAAKGKIYTFRLKI